MSNEMELKKHIKCSLKRGMGIWETWNPKNHYYLYDDFFSSYEEDSNFELGNELKFYLINSERGYRITLTFNLDNIFKIIGMYELYRWVSYCTGVDTLTNNRNKTKVFKAYGSYFQNYYYDNFKDELKNKEVNYFITGCSNYIFEIICLGEPEISFDTFEVEEIEDDYDEVTNDDFFDNEGKLYYFDEIILPFDNYKLDSLSLEGAYYKLILYGEKTKKRYKITLGFGHLKSLMISRRKYFKGKDVECISDENGVRIFYEVEDSEFFELYKQEEFWECGIDDLKHIRFNGCDDFVIDFMYNNSEINVVEL